MQGRKNLCMYMEEYRIKYSKVYLKLKPQPFLYFFKRPFFLFSARSEPVVCNQCSSSVSGSTCGTDEGFPSFIATNVMKQVAQFYARLLINFLRLLLRKLPLKISLYNIQMLHNKQNQLGELELKNQLNQ